MKASFYILEYGHGDDQFTLAHFFLGESLSLKTTLLESAQGGECSFCYQSPQKYCIDLRTSETAVRLATNCTTFVL